MVSCKLEGVALAPPILAPHSTGNKRGLSKGVAEIWIRETMAEACEFAKSHVSF